jgi:hypothetical protein
LPCSVGGVDVSASNWLIGDSTFDNTAGADLATSAVVAAPDTDDAVEPLLFVRVRVAGLPVRLIPLADRIAASSSKESFRTGDFSSTSGRVGDSFVRGLEVTDDPSAFVSL